jgi:hypothetical protein
MNGLSTLSHIAKKTGDAKCDQQRAECGTKSDGMIIISKTVGFAERIRSYQKGSFKPCMNCLNAAHEQGRISEATFQKGLEIRGRAKA